MSSNQSEVDKELAHKVGEELLENALDRARGKASTVTWGRPERDFYIANLSPGYSADGTSTEEGPFSESSPSMVGLRFQPTIGADEYTLSISFDFFYRAFPSLDSFRDRHGGEGTREKLTEYFYHRASVSESVDISFEEDISTLERRINDAVQEALDAEIESVRGQSIQYPDRSLGDLTDLNAQDIVTDEDYEQIRQAVQAESAIDQDWSVECSVKRHDDESGNPEVTISLYNEAKETQDSVCPYLFNQEITIEGGFRRYRFRAIPEDFRYNRDLWAKGINASTSTELETPDEPTSEGSLRTAQVPTHQTYRFDHRTYNDDRTAHGNPTAFEILMSDAAPEVLRAIHEDMQAYRRDVQGGERRDRFAGNLPQEQESEYDRSVRQFQREVERFETGIEVLESHPETALRAFQLMNRTFHEEEDDFENWYVFQIVFIVSNLPSIVSRLPDVELDSARAEEAEILWFPTGGGKTEAYLGLVLFNLFFDRIRGKEAGVSAWIRFPLTLLGEQQMTRFLEKLVAANRVKDRESIPGTEFELGYFVGGQTTPNQVMGSGSSYGNSFAEEFPDDQTLLERKCRVVEECPQCGSEVSVEYVPPQDGEKEAGERENVVNHRCQKAECDVDRLPLYVTDNEIYRYVPSVLLGTLDKIAITGTNPRFANLIGNHTTKCPKHGFGYSGKCAEESTIGCDAELEGTEPEFQDPIPTLHLVDEVHLLNEELGVFASHYETLYLQLCHEFDEKTPKVVTSTATISDREGVTDKPAYARLMQGLFRREANRFPEEGPSVTESFYGEVQRMVPGEQLRTFYGITPNNKTHIYAVLDLVKQYLISIREVQPDSAGEIPLSVDASADELTEILYLYELSIVYFLRKTEKDRFTRSVQSQIRRELRDDGFTDTEAIINIDELTGDSDAGNLLDKYEHPRDDRPAFEDRFDLIAATSFISHGIDFERFNSLFFFGFPRQTFQYIQSSSRVGRKFPGFVLDVFQPFNNRDRHRYKYFEKTHEYLDRTVEETAVARWSRFSLNKTFPGLFRSILLQHFRPLMHREYDVNVQSSRQLQRVLSHEGDYGSFTQKTFTEILEAAYGLTVDRSFTSDVTDSSETLPDEQRFFRDEIQDRVNHYWQYWLNHLNEEFYTTFSEDPMYSLRDIGENIEIRVRNDERPLLNAITPEES